MIYSETKNIILKNKCSKINNDKYFYINKTQLPKCDGVNIIGYTSFEQICRNKLKENCDYLSIGNKLYCINNNLKSISEIKGYIYIGNNDYVQIVTSTSVFIPYIFMILIQ